MRELVVCSAFNYQASKINYKRPDLIAKALDNVGRRMNIKVIWEIYGLVDSGKMPAQFATDFVHLKLKGSVSKSELALGMKSAEVFAHATDFETFGLVVAEAALTGCKVLCSRIPALLELKDIGNIVYVDNQQEKWEIAFAQLVLDNQVDRVHDGEFRERFTREGVGQMINKVYSEAS